MTPPLPLAEAQARLLALATPLPAENVPTAQAVGRCLAAPLVAGRTQPPTDLSAMDGYALRQGETGPWRVIGESAAGHPFAGTVGPGEAIRISTGAHMPAGADAVLLQENATREGDTLALNGEGDPTVRHVRRTGFDFTRNDEILPDGWRVGPGQIALAMSAGRGSLAVHRLPRIAIIDSGDELSADPENCAPHQIPASNGAMLSAMAAPHASRIDRIGPVADRMEALAEALAQAEGADVVVTSGGASVGDHDLVRPALEAWGASLDFWRVNMKPGKPLMVASRDSQVILGLPGNPVSGYVTGYLFLLPLLRRLAGDGDPIPLPIVAELAKPLPATGKRTEFVRARLAGNTVMPMTEQDSSALASLAVSNALILREGNSPAAEKGQAVQVFILENGGIAGQ